MVIGVIYIDSVCNTIRMFSHKIQKLSIYDNDMVGCVLNQYVLVMHSSKLSLSNNIQFPNRFSFAGGIHVRGNKSYHM